MNKIIVIGNLGCDPEKRGNYVERLCGGHYGIYCNAVCPGPVETEMTRGDVDCLLQGKALFGNK